jgi:hypothetical protein
MNNVCVYVLDLSRTDIMVAAFDRLYSIILLRSIL